jgi:hypothetical protein
MTPTLSHDKQYLQNHHPEKEIEVRESRIFDSHFLRGRNAPPDTPRYIKYPQEEEQGRWEAVRLDEERGNRF